MPTHKTRSYSERLAFGNSAANEVVAYINHRLKWGLENTSFHEDTVQKLDYRRKDNGVTYQVKVREKRDDIIYETHHFFPNGDGTYKIKQGRDAKGEAQFYVCKPANHEEIYIVPAPYIKKVSEEAIAELGDVEDQEKIHERWKIATLYDNSSTFLHSAKNGTQVWYGLEKGSDSRRYSKILTYTPINKVPEDKREVIYLKPSERLMDRHTWLKEYDD